MKELNQESRLINDFGLCNGQQSIYLMQIVLIMIMACQ